MTTILVIWVIQAFHCTSLICGKYRWESVGEFASKTVCEKAAAELGIADKNQFRCLSKY